MQRSSTARPYLAAWQDVATLHDHRQYQQQQQNEGVWQLSRARVAWLSCAQRCCKCLMILLASMGCRVGAVRTMRLWEEQEVQFCSKIEDLVLVKRDLLSFQKIHPIL